MRIPRSAKRCAKLPIHRFFSGKFKGNAKKRFGNGEPKYVLSLFDYGRRDPRGGISAYTLAVRHVREVIGD